MAYEKPIFIDNKEAGGDLSSKQYHFVKLNSSGQVVICSGVTDIPHGVLQNAPAQGQTAEVMCLGVSKVVSDGVVGVGALVGTSADGQAAAYVAGTDTTKYPVGRHVGAAAGAAADIITCTINTLSVARGA